MDDRIFQLFKKNIILNDPRLLKLTKKLRKNAFCYVLITCSEPEADGKMQVEMTYEGDQVLSTYLVRTGLKILEQ
jgi:hypothetical protein